MNITRIPTGSNINAINSRLVVTDNGGNVGSGVYIIGSCNGKGKQVNDVYKVVDECIRHVGDTDLPNIGPIDYGVCIDNRLYVSVSVDYNHKKEWWTSNLNNISSFTRHLVDPIDDRNSTYPIVYENMLYLVGGKFAITSTDTVGVHSHSNNLIASGEYSNVRLPEGELTSCTIVNNCIVAVIDEVVYISRIIKNTGLTTFSAVEFNCTKDCTLLNFNGKLCVLTNNGSEVKFSIHSNIYSSDESVLVRTVEKNIGTSRYCIYKNELYILTNEELIIVDMSAEALESLNVPTEVSSRVIKDNASESDTEGSSGIKNDNVDADPPRGVCNDYDDIDTFSKLCDSLIHAVENSQCSDTGEEDMINHPRHYYITDTLETVDVVDRLCERNGEFFRDKEFGYYTQILQYLFRCGDKGGIEDLKKARWWLDRLIRSVEG